MHPTRRSFQRLGPRQSSLRFSAGFPSITNDGRTNARIMPSIWLRAATFASTVRGTRLFEIRTEFTRNVAEPRA